MESSEEKLEQIARRLEKKEATDEDIEKLQRLLNSASDREVISQLGKYNVVISEGQNIHIGNQTYNQWDKKAVQALMQLLERNQQAIEALLKELQKPKSKEQRSKNEQLLLTRVRRKLTNFFLNDLPHAVKLINLDDVTLIKLDDVKLINLDKEWWQDKGQPPNGGVLNSRYQGTIGENKNIFDIFKDYHGDDKQLLILGEPGAGKTTTMLELAKEFLKRVDEENDSRIPVLLELSSWKKDRITMFAWLVDQIKIQGYGRGISKEDLKIILMTDKLLLMLDGLDELEESSRKDCVEAINDLLNPPGEFISKDKDRWSLDCLVVCSRLQEYETLDVKLQLNRAIYLKDLSKPQIEQYLADRDKELRKELSQNIQDKNPEKSRDVQEPPLFLEFWNRLQEQDCNKLQNVLQRPLFLKTFYDAMKPIIDKLNNFNSLEYRQPHLSIFYYMQSCFPQEKKNRQEKKNLEPKTTIRLLIWLAKQLQIHSKTEFFIEKMQPSWLARGTKKWYVLLVALSIFLILLIPRIGFIYYTKRNLDISDSVLYIIVSGVIAVVASLAQKIKVFEKNIVNATFGNYPSLSLFGRRQKNISNQGILNAAINVVCIVGGIAIIFPAVLSIQLIQTPDLFFSQFLALLRFFLWMGLIVALFNGCLTTCIQHFILRLILRCKGHPWNYAEVLDNAVKLKLLRGFGGRYEFIHSPLRESFAILHDIKLPPNTDETDCAS